MKNILFVSLLIFSLSAFSQSKDSILNYTDINGMKQGHWIKKDVDGNVTYEGYFVNNFPVGTFKRYHKNGNLKTQLVFDENRNKYASVKMWDETGELAVTGFYNNKKRDSIWEYFGIKEQMVYHEEYKNGLLHGTSKKYYQSGKLAEEKEWKNGKMNGKWIQYYETGSIRLKSAHVNDARVGDFTVFFADGKPMVTGAYTNDVKNGKWTIYTLDGEVDKEMKFIEGKLENDQELAEELAKELEEAEKLKGQIPEPTEFRNNPEEYFLKRR